MLLPVIGGAVIVSLPLSLSRLLHCFGMIESKQNGSLLRNWQGYRFWISGAKPVDVLGGVLVT